MSFLALTLLFTYTEIIMKIKKALFVKGIVKGKDSWDPTKPQVAFYGRSNAGKSSTLNALVNNKSFAKVLS